MEKVVLVKCFFQPVGRMVTIKVPTGETKTGFFGGEKEVFRSEKKWEKTGYSDRIIDSSRLAVDLQSTIEALNNEGFKVKMITPLISGAYDYQAQSISSSVRTTVNTEKVTGGASYGYGYSYTDSLLVVAEKAC
ncbi:hypothetical protein FJQ87_18345 (plasmid) [Shewanella sp. SNU WT4]|uniref:hypothetical protein n=1 Tax=Shewanella sp. SNU WT4 TaxID=2590015 RepID=UPI001127D295|nr:hypothetical protein [Shewanella sp. SNU WT4]QDF68673.1 hypothetical protein FJQ87_18345 [Shewanella sp. SNU WT4]